MTFDLSRPNFARFTIGLFGYFVTENREDDTQTDKRTHTHTCTHTRNLVLLNYKVCKSVENPGFPFGRGNATGRGGSSGFVTLFSANVKMPTQSYGCCHDAGKTSI